MDKNQGMKRREFLRNSAFGVGAIVGTGVMGNSSQLNSVEVSTPAAGASLKIKEFRTLGRTGFNVSDISTGYVKDPAVLRNLLEAGVNYIDSAESYGNEEVVGSVVKEWDRKKVFITTKMVLEPEKGFTKESFLKRARECLKRLQTDYIDCMMLHSAEKVQDLKTEGFHQAMTQLKQEGRLRFVGVSNHGTNWAQNPEETMEKVLTAAALDGRFDVMLLAYNFIQEDNGANVLKICKEKNIGTTLMKVNPIGNIPRIKDRLAKLTGKDEEKDREIMKGWIAKLEAKAVKADAFIKKYRLDDAKRMRDASIRFVLSNPDVHTVCCGFRNFDDIEAYLALSGTKLSDMDQENLNAYKQGCASLYCRHACGICESACPYHVPVNTILRFNHYFEAQGKEKFAMKNYALLSRPKADLCANCNGQCESACPYGVPAQGLLNLAHKTLTLV